MTGQPQALAIPVRRVWQLVGAVALVVLAFAQGGTLTSPDTKLDLLVDPVRFMGRALNAWDPQVAFGQVQNQAYGYLWPMGPFFAAGDLLQLPPWVTQRLWWSLLLLVAYLGMLRLLALWAVGTPTTRVVGALLFALSPRVLSVVGTISAEAWPLAVLPWILVPLVKGARGGDPRRAALLSALAVACLGAVNAVASLWAVVPAALYLLTRERGPRRGALARWWVLGVPLACLWWLVPLLVQSRVAPPFLSYIESAQVTTAPTSALNALRGTAQWLAYAGGGGTGAIWEAGGWLATSPWGIAATAAVAAMGVAGLAARNGGERRFLALTALLGVVAVGIGYAGSLGSPVAALVQQLLDGPLAPLRNVHKADPLIRLPLAVGLAASLAAAPRLLRPWASRLFLRADQARELRWARGAAVVLVAPILVLAVLPATQGRLAAPGAWLAIPEEWNQVAGEVADAPGTTLLVPASNFAAYTWGRPLDEPIQPVANGPWAVRNAVPLGAPGATRWLDAVQSALASGVRDDRLAAALRAAGISRVVLRNDLDAFSPAPSAAAARAALLASPGIRRVEGYGGGGLTTAGLTGVASGVEGLDALEVFEVEGTPADAVVVDSPVVVVGGPEAVVAGLADVPSVLAPDTDRPAEVVTDTYRLRSQNFGAERGRDLTPTLDRAADPFRGRPAFDVSPWGPDVARAALSGPTGVEASSSAADPFAPGYSGPATAPESAADGDVTTAWVSSVGDTNPRWRRTFPTQPVGAVEVDLAIDPALGAVSEVVVEAGGRTITSQVPADGRVRVDLGGVASDHLEVTLVPAGAAQAPVSIIEVAVSGLAPVSRVVAVPGAAPAARLAAAPGGRRDCVRAGEDVVTCVRGSGVGGEEDAVWARQLTLSQPAELTGAMVALRPSTEAVGLLDRALGQTVSAEGTWIDDPAARPGAALDGDPATAWLVSAGTDSPELKVRYPSPATVTGVSLRAKTPDGRVASVTVKGGGQTRTVRPGRDGVALFTPIVADAFTVRLNTTQRPGIPVAPIRVEEVKLLGAPRPDPEATVVVPCGQGPAVWVGGTQVPLSVRASAKELVDGAAVRGIPCTTASAQGQTTVVAASSPDWRVVSLDLGGVRAPAVTPLTTQRPSAESARWTVGPGPAGRVLATTWGFNRGWRASVDGVELTPVRIDGWRQGWELPESATDMVVQAEFPAGAWHRAGLLVGALGLVLLLVLALRRPRPGDEPPVAASGGGRGVIKGMAIVVPVVLAGVAGLGATLVVGAISRWGARWRVAALLGAAGLALAGAAVALGGLSWGQGVVPALGQVLALLAVAALGWLAVAPQRAATSDGPPPERGSAAPPRAS